METLNEKLLALAESVHRIESAAAGEPVVVLTAERRPIGLLNVAV